ncbi:MAG: amino acid adenylation domain-containing protein [Candidatus Hydrogenedentes bacterium]|nr:amino acid adenylation domain-containing protein [Candidatus Hydrogenedentota bacterium]
MSDKRSELEKRRSRLTPEQRALLEQRLRGGAPAAEPGRTVPVRTPGTPVPLSFSQEGLFFLERLSPGLPEYNVPFVFSLRGPLDAALLSRAFDEVVRRHVILRTRFVYDSGRVTQVAGEFQSGSLKVESLAPAEGQSALELALAKARDLGRIRFDFVTGPLFQAVLYRVSDSDAVLAIVLHHTVFDGWSMGVLFHELREIYSAFSEDREAQLPELQIQFADYAVWQRDRAANGAFQQDLEYWRGRLEGPLPELPFLRPQPAGNTAAPSGGLAVRRLSPATVAAVTDFCQNRQTTLFITLLSVWKTLLFRYSGHVDILVGTAVAGRRQSELAPLIGYFVNTIILRTILESSLTFQQLLSRVHESTLEAQDHQELPFETLVQELKPDRLPGRVPLLQNMFVVQNAPAEQLAFAGIEAETIEVHNGTAKFPLTLMVNEDARGVRLDLEYENGVFDAAAAERLLSRFERVLSDAIGHPEKTLTGLAFLAPEEETLLLHGWNATARDYPRASTIPAVFEGQARKTPHATALAFEGTVLSYEEVNNRANRLARCLAAHGARPGHVVAACMARSSDLVITILAILKAGCAYLPLDPEHPRIRILQVLRDARPGLLIVPGEGELAQSAAESGILAFSLEAVKDELSAYAPDNVEAAQTNGNSLAYVMYTSGSTGGPKGVCVPHRGVLRLVINTDYIDIGPADRIAQASNMAFDAATFEVWGALLNGACLVGIPRDVLLSPRDLKKCLERERIDAIFVTTALFNRIATREPGTFESVGTVLFGGEAVTPKWVRRVLEAGPPRRLLHVYGPTECTTFATWHLVQAVDADEVTIPIGKPIANTTAYVLGDHLCPVPAGIPGELYIGGDGVALGYWEAKELTRQRFVPDPFAGRDGAMLYRTGDLVKRTPDGLIEFLGRMDDQVKIRGFRIEVGEIEGILQQCPGVRDAAVVVRSCEGGGKELVAYYVAQEGDSSGTDAIREHLRQQIPDYMVPSLFVRLMELPLTANGKIDKQNLPEPHQARGEYAGKQEPPATEREIALAALWSDVLEMPHVGRTDNFFDIGGNSLLAIHLMSRIEDAFQIQFPLRDLFEYPRLDSQALRIERLVTPHAQPPSEVSETRLMIPVRAEGSKRPLFFVAGAGDVIGTYTTLVSLLDPEQPFYGFPDPMYTTLTAAEITVERLAELYLREVRSKQDTGPYVLGGYSFGAIVAYEMARQLVAAGEQVGLLVLVDTSAGTTGRPGLIRVLRSMGPRAKYVAAKLLMCFRCRASLLQDFRIIFKIGLSRLFRKTTPQPEEPSIREYVIWSLRDTSRLDRTGRQDSEAASIREARLRMLDQPHIRRLNRSISAALVSYQAYQFQSYPGSLTLIRAGDNPSYLGGTDTTRGWGKVALGGVDVHIVPGTHDTLFQQPYVSEVARHLRCCLERVHSDGTIDRA